jgi:hypothetical protein
MKYDDYMTNDESMEEMDFQECEVDSPEFNCTPGGAEPIRARRRMIEVEEVLGMGSAETTVEVCIPLCPPAFEVLSDLVEKKIEFDALIAGKGKVFINGRLIKDVPYKTRVRTCLPGFETKQISKLTFGNIKHVTIEIPFALCIEVPEAVKGTKVVVLETDINSVEIPNLVNCRQAGCAPVVPTHVGCVERLIRSITEKDCIFVKVKVVKDTIITMNQ